MWGKIWGGVIVAGALAVSGCGGDSSDRPAKKEAASAAKAYFVDNAVIGLRYKCGNGGFKLTGEQGLLVCQPGQTVSFYVGDILLGQATMASGTGFVTPQTLATVDGLLDENVMANVARLLVSLDLDQDPDNGIQIDPAVHVTTDIMLDFSVEPASFATAVSGALNLLTQGVEGGPFALVGESEASEHLSFGLLLSNAGFYEGTVQFDAETSRKVAFLVSREGTAYGTNMTVDGYYASSAFNEGSLFDGAPVPFSPLGVGVDGEFMIDGGTGATYFLNSSLSGGVATGAHPEAEYPTFQATRKVMFEPLADFSLVEALDNLTPLAVDLGGERTFVLDYSDFQIAGMLYSAWGGTPSSSDPANDIGFWFINYADMVSAKDGVIRLLALTTNGYLIDMQMDFNGEVPALNAKWRHLHDGTSGVSTTYTVNVEYDTDYGPVAPPPSEEELMLLSADKRKTGLRKGEPVSSGRFQ